MKFGHFCLPTFDPEVDGDVGSLLRRWVDLLSESESLGFDSLWGNEHHFGAYGGVVPSTPTLLAALSQRTRRARLGTSVVVLPIHHPIEVAEQMAMIDLMSNGRLEFGIGRGGGPYDYIHMGMPFENAQERLQEQLEIILKAWSGEPFSHQGRFYKYPETTVWPRPQQRPHPPIWLSCTQTPSSFEWAGRMGLNLLTVIFFGTQGLVANNKIYRDAWIKAGHAPGKWRISAYYNCFVSEDRKEAREVGRRSWLGYAAAIQRSFTRGIPPGGIPPFLQNLFEEMADADRIVEETRTLYGTPDEVVSALERAQDAMGFTDCNCTFYFGGINFEQAQRSIRLFAQEVMPKLKEREPGRVKEGTPA